jgi:hypothetical protein
MRILVNSSPDSIIRTAGLEVYRERLGCLTSPRGRHDITKVVALGAPWAADNDCFNGLDRGAYVKMLGRLQGIPGCLFVTVPDVVGDAALTLRRFQIWAAAVRYNGYPLAFVAQDGQEALTVPWDEFAVLFIGGTTAWKLGHDAAQLALEAKARGKGLHMGRVNSLSRLRYARALGCDSIDGTGYSRWKHKIARHTPALSQPYNLTFMGDIA